MNNNEPSKDQKILIALRKTLSAVVRETTPPAGMRHPLSDRTIEDIKLCFSLLSAREKELAEENGEANTARPRYVDEAKSSHVVPFTRPDKK